MDEFEMRLVQHCAPTLAGIKTGGLFNYYTVNSDCDINIQIKKWNCLLNPRGVALRVLSQGKDRSMIYVFRPNRLLKDFACPGVSAFLSDIGYDCDSISSCIQKLAERIDGSTSFPHEIGLFLGYPLPDVKGFIENAGQNCKFCGMWKVYGDESQTIKLFEQFKKCTRIYCECLQKGSSVKRLTVAA